MSVRKKHNKKQHVLHSVLFSQRKANNNSNTNSKN